MTMRVPKSAEDTDCEPRDGSAYTGTVNTTANGWTCRSWWRYGYKSHWASADDDFNHNYCRNPNGEDQVWCYTTNPQDPKEHCDVPACVVQTPSVEEIGCIPRDGTAYTGKANTTASGYVCNMWTDAYGHWHTGVGDHNYCRSLPGDKNVWCHSTRPLKTWEQCDVPFCVAPPQSVEEIGCVSRDEPIYTGQANVTASGIVCQIWSENTPHGHSFTGVGEHNYCRSPNGDEKVWCYTTYPFERWEYCNVPACATKMQSAEEIGCIQSDDTVYTGKANTTVTGWACQRWSAGPQEYGLNLVGDHNYCRRFRDEQVWCLTTNPRKRWEYCNVPACVPQTQSAEEIGCIPTDGTAYTGNLSLCVTQTQAIGCRPTDGTPYTGQANTTSSGRTCQMWSVDTPHYSFHHKVGKHNYCRSPDGDDRPWCYTTDPTKGWEHCAVPDCVEQSENCIPTDGAVYTGNTNTTAEGRTCQMWSVNSPHNHSLTGIGEHNYCRSPNGDEQVWCYTKDPRKRWEYCNVPVCATKTQSAEEIGCVPEFPDGTAYTGHLNTTASGRTCQMWSVDNPHIHNFASVGEHNYCRDVAGIGFFCYTTDPETRYENCNVPVCGVPTQTVEDIGCSPINGKAYNGKLNTTRHGRTCKVWSDTEYSHVGEHNYCRAAFPAYSDGRGSMIINPTIFCFVTDISWFSKWDSCDIPICGYKGITYNTLYT